LGCGKDVVDAGAHNVDDVMTQLTKDDLFDRTFTTISERAERHKEITWKPDYSHLQTEGRQKPRITIKFKDSMAFLDGSLAKSVNSLKTTEKNLNDTPTRTGGVKRFTDPIPYFAQLCRGLADEESSTKYRQGRSRTPQAEGDLLLRLCGLSPGFEC
jgi:hypothetical protein